MMVWLNFEHEQEGVPMVPFGMALPFFKHEHHTVEIRHVIVILATSAVAARDFDRLQNACIAKDAWPLYKFVQSNEAP